MLALPILKGKCFYSEHHATTDYLSHILDTIAKGVRQTAKGPYKASIFIDALGKNERKIVGARLRRQQIHIEKIRGVRDESDALIRLADALVGFVRDALEKEHYAVKLFEKSLQKKVINKL